MMVCSTYTALLLLVILQTASESPASCSFPTSLCCPGCNNSATVMASFVTSTGSFPETAVLTTIRLVILLLTTSAITTEDRTSTTSPLTSSKSPTSRSNSVTTEEQKQKDPTRVIMKVRGNLNTHTGRGDRRPCRLGVSLEHTFKEHCGDCTVGLQILSHKAITNDS
ncbi:hypothetical protein AALO_G00016730 [Alosa alosa]|uniref:Uncharacterized protein n=1 Tax=Alosa alosa TaxID=278164 RepID=A0AAV6HGV9_9TELE|nr:hypothetical protein AALO_G00016730 [Alosa alosa]